MTLRTVIIWTLGAAALAYTPGPAEILSKMASSLRRADPAEARVIREVPGGDAVEDLLLVVPARPGTKEKLLTLRELPFPYPLLTLPGEELISVFHAVTSEDASVNLERLNGQVCYVLRSRDTALWISKGDLEPLKIVTKRDDQPENVYLYLDMVDLSEKVRYPSRTEVWRGEELILVERLVSAAATTESP